MLEDKAAVLDVLLKCFGKAGDLTIVVTGKGRKGSAGASLVKQEKSRVEFKVWSTLLREWSNVFAAMLTHDFGECGRAAEVVIDDVSPLAAEAFLRFMYSGTLEHENEILVEVWRLAAKYNVPQLQALCDEGLAKKEQWSNSGLPMRAACASPGQRCMATEHESKAIDMSGCTRNQGPVERKEILAVQGASDPSSTVSSANGCNNQLGQWMATNQSEMWIDANAEMVWMLPHHAFYLTGLAFGKKLGSSTRVEVFASLDGEKWDLVLDSAVQRAACDENDAIISCCPKDCARWLRLCVRTGSYSNMLKVRGILQVI